MPLPTTYIQASHSTPTPTQPPTHLLSPVSPDLPPRATLMSQS